MGFHLRRIRGRWGHALLVSGAGPTGPALALQTAASGARVPVVERRPPGPRPSRALIVHARTLEVLRPLGVAEAIVDRGHVAPSVRLHLGPRELPVRLGGLAGTAAYPFLVLVPQVASEAALAEALAARGVAVERGRTHAGLVRGR